MDLERLGKKRVCTSCKTKFYDFMKKPIICPNCSLEYDDMFFLKKMKSSRKGSVIEDDDDFNPSGHDIGVDGEEEDLVVDDHDSLDVSLNKHVYSEEDDE